MSTKTVFITIAIDFSHLDAIMIRKAGLGETGEMYLVGDDGYLRSNSGFVEEPTILQQRSRYRGSKGGI